MISVMIGALTFEDTHTIKFTMLQRANIELASALAGSLASDKTDLGTRIPWDLSYLVQEALESAGIKTFGDLTQVTESDLLRVKYVGKQSVSALKASLALRGLKLRQPKEWEKP